MLKIQNKQLNLHLKKILVHLEQDLVCYCILILILSRYNIDFCDSNWTKFFFLFPNKILYRRFYWEVKKKWIYCVLKISQQQYYCSDAVYRTFRRVSIRFALQLLTVYFVVLTVEVFYIQNIYLNLFVYSSRFAAETVCQCKW